MISGIDLFGLLYGSVVQPQDDVAIGAVGIVEGRTGDGNGFVRVVTEDGQRASGVEPNALDLGDVDAGLLNNALDTDADAVPDVSS